MKHENTYDDLCNAVAAQFGFPLLGLTLLNCNGDELGDGPTLAALGIESGANLSVVRQDGVVANMVGGGQRFITSLQSDTSYDDLHKIVAHEFGSPVFDIQLLSREREVLPKQSFWSLGSSEALTLDIDIVSEFLVFPSAGSMLHEAGRCKPCAWFWKKQGCRSSSDCRHCHSCVPEELKTRKKIKREWLRALGEAVHQHSGKNAVTGELGQGGI